jgi:exopolysaccharide production protein ExoQ
MLPTVATVFCLLFILYLFHRDLKGPGQPSAALWIPLVWMFLAGSRWVSSWLNLSEPMTSANDYAEGSPIDRAVFFSLIMAGVWVLWKRDINWPRLLERNKWIAIYFAYCLLSALWSDEPFILFKRWVKDLGIPIMALIILTENHPYEAVATVLRRLAFLLLPLSVLFIKYYPDLGRTYHMGAPMYTGVGHQKNDLGLMCLITGIYFLWEMLRKRQIFRSLVQWDNVGPIALMAMAVWLLHMSNSQTSLVCLVTAAGLLWASRWGVIARKPSRIVAATGLCVLLFFILEETLQVKALVLDMLGRDASLTNRTEVWALLSKMVVDPILGAGFMSFWTGNRMDLVWTRLGAAINQAHNGYLEQYLNLGVVGLLFLAAILASALLKVRAHLAYDASAAKLRLCFIVTAILYNYTEASFYGVNNMWLLLMLGSLDVQGQRGLRVRAGLRTAARSRTALGGR